MTNDLTRFIEDQKEATFTIDGKTYTIQKTGYEAVKILGTIADGKHSQAEIMDIMYTNALGEDVFNTLKQNPGLQIRF